MIKSALALLAFLLASPAYADITSIAAIAAGSNGDVQFNNNRRFSADTGNLTYSTSTKALTVQGLVTSTVTVNGITYYFPTSECSGGTFFRYDGGGIVTCSNPSTFTVSTGVALGVWDGAVNITTATSDLSFNADQFVVSLQGDTTASISLNASSVTVMGPLTVAAPITLSGSQFGIDKSSATLLGPNPTLGGDLSGTVTNAVVTDDSHNHTTTSISGLDISADTNLSAAPPIVLSGDTITIDKSSVTLLGPTLEAAELPADGYASTYVNVTGDTMTGQLTNTSSVTVSGALGLRVTYGVTAGTVSVTDDAYDASAWNGSTLVATKNAIRDKIESLSLSAQPILAIATGTTSGYTGVPTSSPTSIMVFDSATHRSQLIDGTTVFLGLNSSSVTLQGQNIIKDQASLQSGAQFNVASGTVQGPMYVGTMTVTGDLSVGDDTTIAGGLTVAGGSGVTVDSLTPLKCVETDASGRLVSASDLCGTGTGGGTSGIETIFGTAQSSPTLTLKGDSNFKGAVTGSTMTISLADSVVISTLTVSSATVTRMSASYGVSVGTVPYSESLSLYGSDPSIRIHNAGIPNTNSQQIKFFYGPNGDYQIGSIGYKSYATTGQLNAGGIVFNGSTEELAGVTDATTYSSGGTQVVNKGIVIRSTGSLTFGDGDNTRHLSFRAPDTVTATTNWILPSADGTGCFQSDGSGNVTIGACGTGGSSLPLPPGATNYIQNTDSLQAGASFYVQKGYVQDGIISSGYTPYAAWPSSATYTGGGEPRGFQCNDVETAGANASHCFYAAAAYSNDPWAFYAAAGKSRFLETRIDNGSELRFYPPNAFYIPYVAFKSSAGFTASESNQTYVLPRSTGTVDQVLAIQSVDDEAHLYWKDDTTAAGGGDNLGTHIATTTLTANYSINSTSITATTTGNGIYAVQGTASGSISPGQAQYGVRGIAAGSGIQTNVGGYFSASGGGGGVPLGVWIAGGSLHLGSSSGNSGEVLKSNGAGSVPGWTGLSGITGNLGYQISLSTGVTGSLPAASIASGSLGAGVIASSIAVDAIGIEQINATGTPDGTTYLRGDGAWETPAGGSGVMTVGNAGVIVGTTTTVDLLAATGFSWTTAQVGSTITIQGVPDTAILATKASIQTGEPLFCDTDSNSGTTYTCSMTPTLTAYTTGQVFNVAIDSTSTGAATLNIDTLGADDLKHSDGSAIGSGDLVLNTLVHVWHNGTEFRLVDPKAVASGGSGTTIWVEEGDSSVDVAVSTVDFNASQFNITSSPSGEANVELNSSSVTLMANTLGGDVTGTLAAMVVGDDSHAHTSTSISGLDVSADTNLAVTAPIVLTDDTISIDKSSATLLGPTVDFNELTGTLGDAQIAAGAVDGGVGGEIADGSIVGADVDTSSFTMRGPDPTLGGDLGGTVSNATVSNDSHDHTGTTISGLDISDDTNLSASGSAVLVGDTIVVGQISLSTGVTSSLPASSIASGSLGASVMASSVAASAFYDNSTVRSNLGLAIGTNVQAYDADLDDLADGSLTGSKVGSGVPAANIASGSLGSSVIASSIAVASVGISQINATGTPDGTTFLRGDGAWGSASGSGDNLGSGVGSYGVTTTTGSFIPATTNRALTANALGDLGVSIDGTSAGTSAAAMFDVSNSTSNGVVIFNNAGQTVGSANSLMTLISTNTTYGGYFIRVFRNDSNSNGEIRIDAPAPNIEFVETDQVSPAGKSEIGINNGITYIATRNSANDSFERVAEFPSIASGAPGVIIKSTGTLKLEDSVASSIGFKAPTTLGASWTHDLWSTPNNTGKLLIQTADGGSRPLAWSNTTGVSGSSTTYSGSVYIKENLILDGTFTGSIPAASVASGSLGASVMTSSVAANSIRSGNIVDGSIVGADVNTSSFTMLGPTVDFSELTGTVGDAQIAAGAVDGGVGGEIADGSIVGADVNTSSFTMLGPTLEDAEIPDTITLTNITQITNRSHTSLSDIGTNTHAQIDTAITNVKTEMLSVVLSTPTTGDTNRAQWKLPVAMTISRVSCSTDVGTLTIQLDERAEATPNTAGTNVMTSALVCDTNTEATTSFTNATIAADVPLNLQITAMSGLPGVVRVHVDYTRD